VVKRDKIVRKKQKEVANQQRILKQMSKEDFVNEQLSRMTVQADLNLKTKITVKK